MATHVRPDGTNEGDKGRKLLIVNRRMNEYDGNARPSGWNERR